MNKVKHFMRSLRSKLPFSKPKISRLSPRPSHSNVWSTPMNDEQHKSPSTPSTLLSFENNTNTAPARSKPLRTMDRNEDVREFPCMIDGVDVYDADYEYNTSDHHPVSVQAELGANVAILDMARKLPLGELNMVGSCLGSPPAECSDGTRSLKIPYGYLQVVGQGPWRTVVDKTVPSWTPSFRSASSHSSESFPLRPLLQIEMEHGIHAQQNSIPELPRSSSQTHLHGA
jgi:hypothetical protein